MNSQIIKFRNAVVNASLAKKSDLEYSSSPLILDCISVLYQEGLIQSFVIEDKKVRIILRNVGGFIAAKDLKATKGSVIMSFDDIARLNSKQKMYLFSTSKGILSRRDCLKARVGGVLCLYV